MGKPGSRTSSRIASVEHFDMQLEMRRQLSNLEVPILQREGNQKEFVFFAFLDGTGQDVDNPKLGPPTTIGHLYGQAKKFADDPLHRIGTTYSKGIGTQSNPVARVLDGMLAYTWHEGIERSYRDLAYKAAKWIDEVPGAEIRVVGAGYSRGGVQATLLQRLIDTYGIADPERLEFGRDEFGHITVISKVPPLVPPGEVVQASLLFDPVATGFPGYLDFRAPGSSISRVSFLATSERRELFAHMGIIEPGMSNDRRSINLFAPGGHSDVGGGNQQADIEIMTGNVVVEHINLLLGRPLFEKREIPTDLSMMKIHQAGGATAAFGLAMDDDGRRDLRDELANCTIVNVCNASEPIKEALASRFEYRQAQMDEGEYAQIRDARDEAAVREADAAGLGGLRQGRVPSTGAPDLDALAAAIRGGSETIINDALLQISRSSDVQAFKQWGRERVAAEQQALAQQEAATQEEVVLRESPAMRR
jgi:hypothetical protein